MPIYSIPEGVPTLLTQNVVIGTPNKMCFITSTLAIDSSIDGTTFAALTGANTTGVNSAARFIRCTTGAPTVLCKRA